MFLVIRGMPFSILRIYDSPSLTGNPCNSCRLSVRHQFPLQWDSVHAVCPGDEKRCGRFLPELVGEFLLDSRNIGVESCLVVVHHGAYRLLGCVHVIINGLRYPLLSTTTQYKLLLFHCILVFVGQQWKCLIMGIRAGHGLDLETQRKWRFFDRFR